MSQIALLQKHPGDAFVGVIPGRALRDRDLSDAALRTLATLVTFQNADGVCWPRLSVLMERRGCSDATIRRHLAELRKRGYLETARRRRKDGRLGVLVYRTIFSPPIEDLVPVDLPEGDWNDDDMAAEEDFADQGTEMASGDHRSEVSGGPTTAQQVSGTTAQQVSGTTAQQVNGLEPYIGTIQENHAPRAAARQGKAKPKAKREETPPHRLPDDWTPPEQAVEYGRRKGVNPTYELSKMRNWANEKRVMRADWTKTYRHWLDSAAERIADRKGGSPPAVNWADCAPPDPSKSRAKPQDPRIQPRLALLHRWSGDLSLRVVPAPGWLGTPEAAKLPADRVVADLDAWIAQVAKLNGLQAPTLPGGEQPSLAIAAE